MKINLDDISLNEPSKWLRKTHEIVNLRLFNSSHHKVVFPFSFKFPKTVFSVTSPKSEFLYNKHNNVTKHRFQHVVTVTLPITDNSWFTWSLFSSLSTWFGLFVKDFHRNRSSIWMRHIVCTDWINLHDCTQIRFSVFLCSNVSIQAHKIMDTFAYFKIDHICLPFTLIHDAQKETYMVNLKCDERERDWEGAGERTRWGNIMFVYAFALYRTLAN